MVRRTRKGKRMTEVTEEENGKQELEEESEYIEHTGSEKVYMSSGE